MESYMRIDPRGPARKIVAVERRTDGAAITTDCGHTYDRNQAFQYKAGASIHCFACKDARDNIKPEYREQHDGCNQCAPGSCTGACVKATPSTYGEQDAEFQRAESSGALRGQTYRPV